MDRSHQATDGAPDPLGEEGPLDVLLIEGSPEEARRFEECLQESPVEANLRPELSLAAGLKALGAPGQTDPDVIVTSAGLPPGEGTSAVEAVVAAAPEIPTVVLVGPGGSEVALQVRKAGVAEALRKENLNPPLLGRTLRWVLREERMQAKLRQRDAWVRSITEGLSAGVFRAGPAGKVEYANEALVELLGFEREEQLIGRDLTEFYADPTDRGRLLAEEWAEGLEVELRRSDGETFVGLLSAKAAYDIEGTAVHYDGTVIDITERKQKERKLRVLSEAVQQAKESVVITEAGPLDEPGPRIEYVNEAFEQMTGYAEEEVLGQTPRMLQGPETDREVLDSVREALEAGKEWEHETINYRKDGEPYRVQWNVAPVTDEDGDIIRWVSVQRDVTDRREREERLRRQNSLLEQTQRLAGAWEVDLRSGETAWTGKLYDIHEIGSETEVSADESLEFYPPEVRPRVRRAFERCVEEQEPYDLEVPFITAEGDRRWVRTTGAPSEISGEKESGEVVKVAGAFQDITERKKAERELRKSRERLQMAVEGGNVGTWDWDIETGEVIFNRQWAEMLGYSREELDFHFSTWEDLVHPDDLERAMDVLDRYIAGETDTYAPEIRMRTKPGDWKWIQTIGKVIDRNEAGEVTRAAGIHLDIDERKTSRLELERQKEYAGRMLDAIDDLFFVLDEEGRLQRWNESVLNLTGYTEAEIGEMTALDLVPEEEEGRVTAKIEEGFAEGRARMEVPLLRKDQAEVPYEVEGNLVKHPEGAPRVVVVGRDITERRRRERQIERQNDLFRRAQEIADVGAWEYDVRSGEFTLTDQGYRIHGLSPDGDMTPERSHDLFHPEDRPKADKAFRRAVEEGEPYDLEARLTAETGEEKWVRTRGEPQRGSGGEVARVRGTVQDITDRKERERRLAVTSQRLEAILQHTSRPMFMKDREGEYLLTNRHFRELHGLKEGEALGQTDEDLFPPEMARDIREYDQTVLREGRTVEQEERIWADGKWRTYLSAKSPLYDIGTEQDPSEPVALFGVATDITERKRREQELEQADTLFEHAQDALFLIDVGTGEGEEGRTYTTERVNPAYEEETGIPAGDLIGRAPRDVYGEAGRRMETHYDRAVAEQEPLEYEEEIPIGGEKTCWNTRIAPVVIGGETEKIVGTTRDVTEQKRREQALREAKEEAEAANRMKSAFLATMSHEIRTPLTSVLGFAEAIEEKASGLEPPAEAADLKPLGRFAGLIQRSGHRLMRTLTGVLNLSRLEAGEMDLVEEPVDLAAEAREVAEELRPQAEEKGLGFQVHAREGSPIWAQADEGGVQIVLRNLISNAIKYTEEGRVDVRAYPEGGEAVLEVEDSGIGMDPSQAEDLFEPFRQESEGWSREYEGTGLGLAVTREAAEQMGGSVEVETQKGEGSRFTVRLPMAEEGDR